jgi:tetratricopeptide (TPR) repeat protein
MERPIQHIIETRSRKAFETLLPDEWVIRPLTPDYGLDYMVEIFRDRKSTGKIFTVQLKGTQQKITDDKVRIKIKTSTLEYYASLTLPTLLVIHSMKENRFWGIWINDFVKTKQFDKKRKEIQIKLNRFHLINDKFFSQIETAFCLTLPSKVNISYNSNHEIGEEYHSTLIRWISHFYPDFFVFGDEHFPIRLLFNYHYDSGNLRIDLEFNVLGFYQLGEILSVASSDLLMYPSSGWSKVPEELVEPLFLIATLFAENRPETALILYRQLICNYSGKFKDPSALWKVGQIALENNLISHYQDVIKTTIDCNSLDDFQHLNMAYLFHRPYQVLTTDYYGENILHAISQAESDDWKGMQYYNLANFYLRRNGRKAIKCYIKAGRLRPWYLEAGFYWWFELGTAFFSQRRFICAERCYLKVDSITTEERPLIFSMIGDCLFYQGRFAEAKKWIEKYLAEEERFLSHVYLTGIVADILLENKLDRVKRNPKRAMSLLEKAGKANSEERTSLLEQALQYDPLSADAWFQLGVLNHKSGKRRDSFFQFLISCIIEKANRGAWLNAFFQCSALNEEERALGLFVADAMIGEFGKTILDDIRDMLKEDKTLSEAEKKSRYGLMVKFVDILEVYQKEGKMTSKIEKMINQIVFPDR